MTLADGRVIKKAKDVHIGPEWTDWRVGKEEGRAHTGDVVSVALRGKRRTFLGTGIGAGVGLLLAAFGSDDSPSCPPEEICFSFDLPDEEDYAVVGAVTAGALGAGIGSLFRKPDRVVYVAPIANHLAAPGSDLPDN